MQVTESDFFSTQELCSFLGVSKKFIQKHRAKRIPGAVKVGHIWRFRKTDIEKRLLSGQFLLPVDKG